MERDQLDDLHCALAWLGRQLVTSKGLDEAECVGVALILGCLSEKATKIQGGE